MANRKLKLAIELKVDSPEDKSLNAIVGEVLKQHRDTVVVWLAKRSDINAYTYEGGIDSWWGFGSVMLCELGITVSVKLADNSTTVILE